MWPRTLYLVRHAESTGNVASVRANREASDAIDIPADQDLVTLTPAGEEQARALGSWLAVNGFPCAIWTSPYRRAVETASILAQQWNSPVEIHVDERLRERDLGVLDRLTATGIRDRYPEEAARRAREGKFLYRPPGGESWEDVTRRLAGTVADMQSFEGGRLLVVTHQAIVLCLRFVIENMSVESLMAIDATTDVANCSLTEYTNHDGALRLVRFNDTEPLRAHAVAITQGNDAAGNV